MTCDLCSRSGPTPCYRCVALAEDLRIYSEGLDLSIEMIQQPSELRDQFLRNWRAPITSHP